jgi:hypothetical protein
MGHILPQNAVAHIAVVAKPPLAFPQKTHFRSIVPRFHPQNHLFASTSATFVLKRLFLIRYLAILISKSSFLLATQRFLHRN